MVRHGAKGNQSSSDGFVPEDKSPMILFEISDSVEYYFQHYHVPKYKSFLWNNHTKRLRSMQRIYD